MLKHLEKSTKLLEPDNKSFVYKDGKLYHGKSPLRCVKKIGNFKIYAHKFVCTLYIVEYFIVDTETGKIYQTDENYGPALDYYVDLINKKDEKPQLDDDNDFDPLA